MDTTLTAAPPETYLPSPVGFRRISAPEALKACVRVMLVDDHDMVRIGLRAIMSSVNLGHEVEWLEARNLEDAIQAYSQAVHGIDLVLLDMNLADSKGLQGLSQFLHRHPKATVAIMSGTSDEFIVGQARSMGAVGYLSKSAAPAATQATVTDLIRQAVDRHVEPGQRPSGGRIAGGVFPALATYDRVAELGPRHLEILELLLSGCTNLEISRATKLSLGTVKNYVSTILLALDVKSRSHLICLFR